MIQYWFCKHRTCFVSLSALIGTITGVISIPVFDTTPTPYVQTISKPKLSQVSSPDPCELTRKAKEAWFMNQTPDNWREWADRERVCPTKGI